MGVVSAHAIDALRAPLVRLTGPDTPSASSWLLEQAGVPNAESVKRAVMGIGPKSWRENGLSMSLPA